MAVSNIKAFFLCQVQKVWEIVTDIKNYTWRIDLSKTEILMKISLLNIRKMVF
jgi:hypothetical protein